VPRATCSPEATTKGASILHFHPFSIDLERQQLLRDGEVVGLSPHLVEILGHLAINGGQTITRNALLDRFWPDVNVTENTLSRAIADIRRALQDDAANPRFIRTVARRGYRFVAPVEKRTPAPADPFAEWERGKLTLELLDARQLEDAAAAVERAVAATPSYAPAHAALASARLLQFERTRSENIPDRAVLERAVGHARRATELDPSLGEAWATLGFTLFAAGRIEEARAAARRAAALEPTSWRHQFRLAIATWGEERLRAVDRTLSLLPDFAQARFLAGMVFVARQAFDRAETLVSKGAERQTREASVADTLFPPFGLHWLHGLVLLQRGAVGDALRAFTREIDTGRATSLYYPEFKLNAVVASGFAHLAAADADGAIRAFREAIELQPANGRALVGLQRALVRANAPGDASQIVQRVEETIAALEKGGRSAEARLIRAAADTASGQLDAAIATLDALLDQAPPGQVGWQIPIDPALAELRTHPGFERVLTRLAARAS
jgi:DNA-binding winged helix-turn-helix (wHTH) protein/cytochrome c-type biogenesis protein CcmH/NrfG